MCMIKSEKNDTKLLYSSSFVKIITCVHMLIMHTYIEK